MKAMAALARAEGKPRTIAEISEAQSVPKKFLEHILLQVKTAGLVTSKAGPRGGYTLARASDSCSLADLFAAIEEPIARKIPVLEGAAGSGSSIVRAVDDIRTYALQRLSEISIKDLSEDSFLDQDMEAFMYYI
jgi:Rrf2 family protein